MYSSGNRQATTHYNNLLTTFKNRAFQITKEFKEVLEMRTKTMEQQDRRRGKMYSQIDFENVGMANAGDGFADLESGGTAGRSMGGQYASSRSDAVQSVQKVIGELGSMFQNMAQMVTQQEEMLMRIDQSLDDTIEYFFFHLFQTIPSHNQFSFCYCSNVETGTGQLLKYWNNISSNRSLIIKVFAILIAFMIFFIIFIA